MKLCPTDRVISALLVFPLFLSCCTQSLKVVEETRREEESRGKKKMYVFIQYLVLMQLLFSAYIYQMPPL